MSRMIACLWLGCIAAGTLQANDPLSYPPGQRPFHSPKAPQPTGVLAPDACFGFHATRWTPWNAACSNSASGVPFEQSCTASKGIILFEEAPATTSAPSSKTQLLPAPESRTPKPMPPVKK